MKPDVKALEDGIERRVWWLKANYAIKPIAEQALGSNRTILCRNGLLRR